ncbi:MAG: alpha/beta fold hydrolase [Myxococcales bacterium]
MAQPKPLPESHPTVDDVDFKSLYRKTTYEVRTADHWTLVITRYRPVPQSFPQPIFGEPILLVHGFSQNRHTWTSGEFVKNLLFFGADVHILELRGHGKSSLALQREKQREEGARLPSNLDYGWDIDDYFLYDLPAAVDGVRRATRRPKIFYCGHSMGGMLGYGYAGIHKDLEGLVTIGSPSDLGRGFLLIRLVSFLAPLEYGVDASLAALNAARALDRGVRRAASSVLGSVGARRLARRLAPPEQLPRKLRFRYVPMDQLLRLIERALSGDGYRRYERLSRFSRYATLLSNPQRVTAEDIRWLLREGGEREPRGVVLEFARWVRNGELCCYRTGYDFKRNFPKITVPVAIIFGDLDRLASVDSTRGIYHGAKSEYLLWRPVKGNSHLELTMGHDIRQICYDIKNLVQFAVEHRGQRPSLPRRDS